MTGIYYICIYQNKNNMTRINSAILVKNLTDEHLLAQLPSIIIANQ